MQLLEIVNKSFKISVHGEKRMPVIQVSVWAGISEENKKKMVEGITKVCVDMGMPAEAVTVMIMEVPKSNWASGGKLHSEIFANR